MMIRRSWMIGWLFALTVTSACAQSWSEAYDKGLKALKSGSFADARTNFKQAIANRPEDFPGVTTLPGPISEQRKWRNGAAYSPNFLAAYASFKQAQTDKDNREALYSEAAGEFETLIAKKQFSFETFYLLNLIYQAQGATQKRLDLEKQFAALNGKATFRVDTEGLTPEENAAVASTYKGGNTTDVTAQQTVDPGTNTVPVNPNNNSGVVANPVVGRVATLANKFAFVIGNSTSKMDDLGISFGSDDAQLVREALITNAGYPEENVDLALNATAAQILKSAKALADRIPDQATVFIYFAGAGINSGGKDYLAGVDTESATDTSSMAAKAELYRIFSTKGARIYAFFEANRPIANGRYFGMEVPIVGSISQMQATIPGDMVYAYTRNGKMVGLFGDAIASATADIRSNRLPILEFGWQVFYKMRRAGTGGDSGSSNQTCTLPVLTNLASDSRF